MKAMERIKERIFEVRKDPELAKALFPELDQIESYGYAYAIYIDTGKLDPVWGYLTNSLRDNEEPGFQDHFRGYLTKYQPGSFNDFLFLVDSYCLGRQVFGYPVAWEQYRFDQIRVVDDILRGSKGIVLWHYQLEQLFGCFYRDPNKTRELRKAINQKKLEVFELAENLTFKAGESLGNVIRERMIFGVSCNTNFSGALALFDHFRSNGGSSHKYG